MKYLSSIGSERRKIMAYNPYFPYYSQQYQPQQSQQIQSTGLISVRSIDEAMRYPVAPGNSVTFKDETAPYVYTKTMGFSQFDRPVFEKYRIIKEETEEETKEEVHHECGCKSLKSEVEQLKKRVKEIEDEFIEFISANESKSDGGASK